MSGRRAWWGWGFEDRKLDPAALAPTVRDVLGFPIGAVEQPVALESIALPEPRVDVPAGAPWSVDPRDRIEHAYGRSFPDTVRAFRGRIDHPPDAVAFARHEDDIEMVLEWAAREDVAVIPFGGGTSVVGGVEPRVPGDRLGTVSLDLSGLDRVVEVDAVSRAARIQAGATGPQLEAQLAEHGLTMRFFPQSFELSTLGGWVVTRAGGHFATVWTHIDDLVESIRAITPTGAWESRRLPGSGAGPSPDRMLLGSEGILGVVTEAWVRVQPKPAFRAARAVRFKDFMNGAEAVRALAQSGLNPANCRLVDALEARQTGVLGPTDRERAVLVLGFESVDHDVDGALARGLAICREHGGEPDEPRGGAGGAVGTWRDAFIAMPYLRDALLQLGVLSDTFETAITWERFPAFHAAVTGAVREALGEPCRVTCRLTHVYPDGPAPYFTVLAPARRGDEVAQWEAMKHAASDAILAAGGTITHHHAVGRDHRPWYDAQRPDLFAAALRAAKAAVDPAGVLNPGVLVDA
ncbi:MAG TPA: FAD-binding oxidoreductase [Baekduia sp.]|uniref:FAD-binding oxidoreductase n=1 Tax=Baekduia sp. TaxID=2600305 RepID=UPI002C3CB5C4|nr:FAD-binding oxidoreductase [Baekduia sp.]HMJ35971.1 FAD-binding oxidoreductase [Baekduia sp.]